MNSLNITKDELWKIKKQFSNRWIRIYCFALYYSTCCAGYQVKATVRDLSRTNKLNQTLLNGLEKYEGKSDLSVDWQVTNLSSDEGWDEAMAGCDYVFT